MLTQTLQQKHTKNFHVYDIDNSGYVEQVDLERWAYNLAQIRGWESGTPEFENLVTKFREIWLNFWQPADANGDGKVSLEEYLQVAEVSIHNFPNSQKMQDAHAAKAKAIFTVLDLDQDGEIFQVEYVQFCEAVGLDATTAKSAFAKLTENKKDHLSWEDYFQRSKEFHVGDDPHAPGNWLYGEY